MELRILQLKYITTYSHIYYVFTLGKSCYNCDKQSSSTLTTRENEMLKEYDRPQTFSNNFVMCICIFPHSAVVIAERKSEWKI